MVTYGLSMLFQTKLLDGVLGKLEGGELVELPDGVHVSSKGGLWIESDKLYNDDDFSDAASRIDQFYANEEGNQSTSQSVPAIE